MNDSTIVRPMNFKLPPLPFRFDYLEPFISRDALEYHYLKHHQGYVDKLNTLTKDTDWANVSVEELIRSTEGNIYNNAAQVWNHAFYWHSFTRDNTRILDRDFEEAINDSFGSFELFREQFLQASSTLFGSGWTWLVLTPENKLSIMQGPNAWNPIVDNNTPLFVCDVWEHAYYLDYKNRRMDYLEVFWKLINWEAVESRYLSRDHLMTDCC
jgi:Fe-Mn family superoxide dismutase